MKLPWLCVVMGLSGLLLFSGIAVAAESGDAAAVARALAGDEEIASAAWWGFDAEDATPFLQAAIDSGVKRLSIPFMGKPWIVRPLFLHSNLELIFEPGVVLLAKKDQFKGKSDSLITARNCENIKLSGYNARLVMNKRDYQSDAYEAAEWRMTLNFVGCTNIHVEGLRLEASGGDGIYLGASSEQPYCKNVVIRDVACLNHHRQGISVISADSLLIENCELSGTQGTAPQAGIDLEPNRDNERLVNVVIRNCTMAGNKGSGILLYLRPLRASSTPLSILFENCHIRNGLDHGITVGALGDDGPGGSIVFRNCTVEHTRRSGINVYDKSASAAQVHFIDCHLNAVAEKHKEVAPVQLSLNRESIATRHGGIYFDECVVYDTLDRPVLKSSEKEGDKGVHGLEGSLRREGPGAARMVLAPESTGCSLQLLSDD
ncbi:MAG: right-handed parallel beta-helix repeat-containing protein [Candidatus Hydrogenedentales bacterium]